MMDRLVGVQQRQAAHSTIAVALRCYVGGNRGDSHLVAERGSVCLRGQGVLQHVGGGCPRPQVVQLGLLKALSPSPLLMPLLDGADAAAYEYCGISEHWSGEAFSDACEKRTHVGTQLMGVYCRVPWFGVYL